MVVVWATPSHTTLAIWVRVRVPGTHISQGFWKWGCQKRGYAHVTVTPQSLVSGIWQNPLSLTGPVLQ